MHPIHHWEEILEELQHARTRSNYQQRRKAKEENREHKLNSHFPSAFFGFLPPPDSKKIGLSAERVRNARTEPICLN
jgi:hypothetical protein